MIILRDKKDIERFENYIKESEYKKIGLVPISKRKLKFVRGKILKQARERGLIGPQRYIYESPDNGKTVYRRKFNEYDKKELLTK